MSRASSGCPGTPDLTNKHDIERRIEGLGNLKTDGDTAARQRRDQRPTAPQMCQLATKPASGFVASYVFHPVASEKIGR